MTEKVGIIGWKLAHTLSPAMHNAAFRALDMDWHYDVMEIPPDIVRLGLIEPQRHGYVGLNVTIPHKEAISKLVKLDEVARAIGAVNTVDLRSNTGTNTDVIGLIDDLKANDIDLEGVNVLVLGAGGAARAAVFGLVQTGANVTVVNRTKERAQMMVANLTVSAGIKNVDVLTLDEAVEKSLDLIVNCTSAGMYPNVTASPWVEGIPFPHGVTVYDLIYRPVETALTRLAESHAGRGISGLGMLVRQGAASFKLWTGIEPPLDVMFDAARDGLAER